MAKKSYLKVDISLAGDDELMRTLDELASEANVSLMVRKSAEIAMWPVLESAKQAAPRDTGKLSHYLKILPMGGAKARGFVGARVVLPSRQELGIAPDAPGYYPSAQEFGWEAAEGVKTQPKRYIRNALYRNRELVFRVLRVNLWREIGRWAKRRKRTRLVDRASKGAAG